MSQDILRVAKRLDMQHNVCIRVIDEPTGKVVSEHIGHNAATNSLLTGIGHYLMGEAEDFSSAAVSSWIPRYISLGTMGLSSQEEDEEGLPAGIGDIDGTEEERFVDYIEKCPGFGSDGYDTNLMNGREFAGLGPDFSHRNAEGTVGCELISDTFPRAKITFRDVVPEYEAEIPKTIDVTFSAMVSTGALKQFRENDKGYVFISEVGLWSSPQWVNSGENGLLAGYRICPADQNQWDMSNPDNRKALKRSIIKVGTNQVAQVIWKIQLGGIEQLGGLDMIYPQQGFLLWKVII